MLQIWVHLHVFVHQPDIYFHNLTELGNGFGESSVNLVLLLSITFGVRVNPGIHQVYVLPLVSGVVFIAGSLHIQVYH